VALYTLEVELKDVDLITGVTVTFAGKVKGSKKPTVFAQSEAPFKGSINFLVRGKGDRLTGTLSFSSTDNASFVDEGITYSFINPGAQRVRIKENSPFKDLSIELSKASPKSAIVFPSIPLEGGEILAPSIFADALA
jgi:hypothetical protein